jgi:hypothetical protein
MATVHPANYRTVSRALLIGYERRFNAFLQFQDVKSFTNRARAPAPPDSTYYPRMKN